MIDKINFDGTGTLTQLQDAEREYSYGGDEAEEIYAQLQQNSMDQDILRKVALWKLGRILKVDQDIIDSLDKVKEWSRDNFFSGKHKDEFSDTLVKLLGSTGVGLPMASTFLRFRNPEVFQIVDRRAYRAVFGEKYKEPPTEKATNYYLNYLQKLIEVNSKFPEVEYSDLDKILYQWDIINNRGIKLY